MNGNRPSKRKSTLVRIAVICAAVVAVPVLLVIALANAGGTGGRR